MLEVFELETHEIRLWRMTNVRNSSKAAGKQVSENITSEKPDDTAKGVADDAKEKVEPVTTEVK